MKRTQTILFEAMNHAFALPVIEPEQRVKDLYHVPRGHRHVAPEPRYIWHTYPIKGGITGRSLMLQNITQNNALLKRLRERQP